MVKNPLKLILAGGFIIALILALTLVFYLINRNPSIHPAQPSGSFFRELEKYDISLHEKPETLNRYLDGLEKRARTQEEWLSVLKRRRFLAQMDSRFIPAYQKSCHEAVRVFPYSGLLAAVAAESQIQGDIQPELLRIYAKRIIEKQFVPLVLGLYILAGDLEKSSTAAAIPKIEELLRAEVTADLKEALLIDEFLLNVLRGEAREATIQINTLLRANPESRDLFRLGGEFFYDYGNPLRGAELFYRLGGDEYIGRSADALALAKEIPAARNIWAVLASSPHNDKGGLRERSLYNLAATAANQEEAALWLEKLFSSQEKNNEVYAILRYTRLQNTSRSIAILEEANLRTNPLFDLELLRRRLDTWPVDRASAEVWLLLGRHPDAEVLYQWGAWYFEKQKLHSETAQLLKIAVQRQISAPWLRIYQGLTLLREGTIEEGLKILEAEKSTGNWRTLANIARVQEGYRSILKALENYEDAAALADNPQDLSLIQIRISRCLEALGRFEESRRALEYALELDPENLHARTELWRLDK